MKFIKQTSLRLAIFIFFLLNAKFSFGQDNLQNLKAKLAQAYMDEDSLVLVEIHESLGGYYFSRDMDSCVFYLKNAISYCNSEDEITARCYQNIAFAFYENKEMYDSALFYSTKAYNIWFDLGEELKQANLLKFIGLNKVLLGESLGKSDIFRAIKIFDNFQFQQGVAVCYFDLAIAFEKEEKLDSCLIYLDKSKQIWKSEGQAQRIFIINNFIIDKLRRYTSQNSIVFSSYKENKMLYENKITEFEKIRYCKLSILFLTEFNEQKYQNEITDFRKKLKEYEKNAVK